MAKCKTCNKKGIFLKVDKDKNCKDCQNKNIITKEKIKPEGIEKEKFKGLWNDKEVSVNRNVRGYRLTDKECETLLNGDSVTFNFKSKANKPYQMTGKLADMEYSGYKYVGVDLEFKKDKNAKEKFEGTWYNQQVKVNRNVRGYRLTDKECETLLNGDSVTFNFLSKANKPYQMTGKLANMEYEGYKYIGIDLEFKEDDSKETFTGIWQNQEVKVNRIIRGYRLTDRECNLLLDGHVIAFTFLSKANKPYQMYGKLNNLTYKGRRYVGVDLFFEY